MPDSATIVATGQLSANDLYRFSVTTLLRKAWWLAGIMVFVGAWFLITISKGHIRWEWSLPNVIGPLFPFVIFPYAFFIAPYFAAKKRIETTPALNGLLKYKFSNDGLDLSGPHSQSHVEWSGLVEARETSTQFLLFLQASSAHVVPKRFLAGPEDESALRALLRAHVTRTKLHQ